MQATDPKRAVDWSVPKSDRHATAWRTRASCTAAVACIHHCCPAADTVYKAERRQIVTHLARCMLVLPLIVRVTDEAT